jgi:hypothetical protein
VTEGIDSHSHRRIGATTAPAVLEATTNPADIRWGCAFVVDVASSAADSGDYFVPSTWHGDSVAGSIGMVPTSARRVAWTPVGLVARSHDVSEQARLSDELGPPRRVMPDRHGCESAASS